MATLINLVFQKKKFKNLKLTTCFTYKNIIVKENRYIVKIN